MFPRIERDGAGRCLPFALIRTEPGLEKQSARVRDLQRPAGSVRIAECGIRFIGDASETAFAPARRVDPCRDRASIEEQIVQLCRRIKTDETTHPIKRPCSADHAGGRSRSGIRNA